MWTDPSINIATAPGGAVYLNHTQIYYDTTTCWI